MSSSPRPRFFCTRPNGTVTPLIAVDELPTHISIRGIPRVLSFNDTEGMTSLGTVSPRGHFYTVEGTTPAVSRPSSTGAMSHRTRSHDLHTSLMRLLADENIPSNQRLALNALLQQGVPQTWHVNSAPTPATGWLVPNSGSSPGSPSARQKEYCSYWIRHGECDYQQQGCLYKHEMPQEKSMLEKLGLRDIPRWYREKYNVSSLGPNGHGHLRSHIGNSHAWKDDGTFKSIQFPPHLGPTGAGEPPELEKHKQKHAAYLPTQQHQQATLFPRSSPMTYQSPTAPVPTQTPNTSPSQLDPSNKKIDLLSFEHPDYGLLYRPSNENNFEAPGKAQHKGLIRNLQTLAHTPVPVNAEYLPGSFDSTVGAGRSKRLQRSRKLYEPRSHHAMPDSGPETFDTDVLHAFQNLAVASSSGASVASKATGSQLASPVADAVHGSTTSEPPTRGPSPTSLSPGASPSILRGRGKDKNYKRAPGTICQKRTYRKRSTGSSDDDMFFH
ncbi:hypothetical protein BDW59DRAFT_156023 [Aspergillus cavernicola]|uniref:C3H1-type domain-containing protein n=1 Tax=Aspergillus cavernicola TaxID=176166 RepID=A0ABR4J576_9EURO